MVGWVQGASAAAALEGRHCSSYLLGTAHNEHHWRCVRQRGGQVHLIRSAHHPAFCRCAPPLIPECAGQNLANLGDNLFVGSFLGHKSDIADGSLSHYEFRTMNNIVGTPARP